MPLPFSSQFQHAINRRFYIVVILQANGVAPHDDRPQAHQLRRQSSEAKVDARVKVEDDADDQVKVEEDTKDGRNLTRRQRSRSSKRKKKSMAEIDLKPKMRDVKRLKIEEDDLAADVEPTM